MQRLQRHDHLDGGAVGVGDDPLGILLERVGVDLGHHQGHLGVHAPGAGVINDDGSGPGGDGAVLAADPGRRAGQDDIDAGERLGPQRLDGVLFALELDGFARAALGSQELDGAQGELVFRQHLPHDLADRTGRADYRNAWHHRRKPFRERRKRIHNSPLLAAGTRVGKGECARPRPLATGDDPER